MCRKAIGDSSDLLHWEQRLQLRVGERRLAEAERAVEARERDGGEFWSLAEDRSSVPLVPLVLVTHRVSVLFR